MKFMQDDNISPPDKWNATRKTQAIQSTSENPLREQSSADFEQLLAEFDPAGMLAEGQLLKGKVLSITPTEVLVDVGYKSEGVIPIEEFRAVNGTLNVKAGDEIEVLLESAEDHHGHIVLSREKAERSKVWDDIERAFREQTVLQGIVLCRTKGGLSVDIGTRAFLPGSQIDLRPIRNLDAFVGRPIDCRVIKINKLRNNIVVSRKCVVEERQAQLREQTLRRTREGSVLRGMVKNITNYGVFVDLGGLDGLLHVSDIFWGRPSHPSRIFRLGMEIEILVLKFDREKERVSLGYKQLQTDPWLSVSKKYPPGCRVHGRVVSLTDYGAFVEIEEGVEGLVHISEMSWSKRLKSPSELLSVGDSVEVVVLDVNPEERRMALGMKQTVPDPWVIFAERHSIGQVVGGRVSHLTEFGAFVEVAPEVDGLVHISDLASFRKGQHPSELFRKGDPVNAVIVALDLENRRLSLSIHALAAAAKAGATLSPLGERNASAGFGGDRSS